MCRLATQKQSTVAARRREPTRWRPERASDVTLCGHHSQPGEGASRGIARHPQRCLSHRSTVTPAKYAVRVTAAIELQKQSALLQAGGSQSPSAEASGSTHLSSGKKKHQQQQQQHATQLRAARIIPSVIIATVITTTTIAIRSTSTRCKHRLIIQQLLIPQSA